jgi:hypothetical protein
MGKQLSPINQKEVTCMIQENQTLKEMYDQGKIVMKGRENK